MALHLFCHSTLEKTDVEEALRLLSVQNVDIFSSKFLISKVEEASDIDKEIASEHGLESRSIFLIRVNDKSAAGYIREVAALVRNALGVRNILVLFENETEVGDPST